MLLYEEPKIANIKSKLKKVRLIKGYTQENLSKLSGVNIKSITLYEQQPDKFVNASIGTVYKISDALGCDIEDIINKEYIGGE